MRRTAILFALIVVLLQGTPASAQPPRSVPRQRIVTTTRLVAKFSDLEERLTSAMQQKDQATLNAMLSDDFEQWTSAPPGDPTPREEWLHNVLTSFTLHSFQLRQMAVRTVDQTELVSFVRSQQAVCGGRDCDGDVFIVDLWQQHNDTPQLLVRYESLVQKLSRPLPEMPPRPTGKE